MKTVVIPVETKSRELYGKLWLSLNLVSKDMEVILGDKRLIRKQLFNIDPDFYIAVGAGGGRKNTFKELSKRTKIGILDTEGAVFQTQGSLIKRYSAETLEHVDLYFSWGREQSELMESEFSETGVEIISTGNPRFDLLHPPLRELYSQRSAKIQAKKPYILFITNFSRANHYRGTSKRKQSEEFYHQSQMVDEFITAAKTLANTYSRWNFIIRPHPSEDHETYEEHFLGTQNISVNYAGDVRTWIYDATAVVHAGSTAGIESKLMETPTIGYLPVDGYTYPPLPINVSLEATSVSELSSILDKIYTDINEEMAYDKNSSPSPALHNWFANAKKPTSAEAITKNIKNSLGDDQTSIIDNKYDLEYASKGSRLFKSMFYTDIITRVLKYNQTLLNTTQKNTTLDFSQYPSLSGQRFQMFPGTSASELEDMRNDICGHSCINNNITIERITPWADVYRLQKQGSALV